MEKEKITLNPDTPVFEDEAVIDVFSNELGGYCGSFTVQKSDLNSALTWCNGEISSRTFNERKK